MADFKTAPATGESQFRVPFDPLGADSIRALCQLLNPEDEEDNTCAGLVGTKTNSHLTPGDLASREPKPRARPNVKVEAKETLTGQSLLGDTHANGRPAFFSLRRLASLRGAGEASFYGH
ncbi:sarcoma antigen ny-sar-97 [Cystoisospora suis]|uniref:Sarcoma antigen ny-sar-97 n=1 Tax=Cystoisospora suis TaxID=483139 RepID=A0A2C6K370_9APIC|nr:sarcoma antigen ny-sar-97 [Cystoisospora suis]